MYSVITGILYGLMASIMLGQVFVITITESAIKGKFNGFMFAFGAFLVDMIYISVLYFGLFKIEWALDYFELIGTSGSIILLVLGVKYLLDFKNPSQALRMDANRINSKTAAQSFAKGIIINTINPFPIITWFAFLGTLMASRLNVKLVIIGMGSTIFTLDVVKVLISGRLNKMLSPKQMHYFLLASGLALLVLAMVMLARIWVFH